MLIPQQAKTVVKNQLYNYPHVKLHSAGIYHKPMDIVFVSYDETNAEANWTLLSEKFPRAKRVDKIEGQLNALQEAAKLCDTPFIFYVFGKNNWAQHTFKTMQVSGWRRMGPRPFFDNLLTIYF